MLGNVITEEIEEELEKTPWFVEPVPEPRMDRDHDCGLRRKERINYRKLSGNETASIYEDHLM